MSVGILDPTRPTAAATDRRPVLVQLVLLLAGSCMPILGAVLIAPVLPQLAAAFAGVDGVDILVPIVLTVPALVIGLTAPFAGLLADALDRKRVLIIAMVAYSVFARTPGPRVATRANSHRDRLPQATAPGHRRRRHRHGPRLRRTPCYRAGTRLIAAGSTARLSVAPDPYAAIALPATTPTCRVRSWT